MARVLLFYKGGVTVSDYDALTEARRRTLVEVMEASRANGR